MNVDPVNYQGGSDLMNSMQFLQDQVDGYHGPPHASSLSKNEDYSDYRTLQRDTEVQMDREKRQFQSDV